MPGTATIDGKTYTLADASSYADKFTHSIKSVVRGLPSTPTAQKLILGCYDPDMITILRTPLGKLAKINVPQTFFVFALADGWCKYDCKKGRFTILSPTGEERESLTQIGRASCRERV